MRIIYFWVAVLLSGFLHAGALAAMWVLSIHTTPPALLEAWGDSDTVGLPLAAIGEQRVFRVGPGNTVGGDDAPPETPFTLPEKEEPPVPKVEPIPEPTPKVPEPAPEPVPGPVVEGPSEKAGPPAPAALETATAKSGPPPGEMSAGRAKLPGASGGAPLPKGMPSRGGIAGVPTGLRELSTPPVVYPAEARRLGQEGRPKVWLHISAEGDVIAVRLHESCGYPLLDEAALRYARQLKFRPASIGDTPVECSAIKPVKYYLH